MKRIIEDIKTGQFRRAYVLYGDEKYLLKAYLKRLLEALGDRRVCAARELTKINEEYVITTLSKLDAFLRENEPRGEYVLIVEGAKENGKEAFFVNMTVGEHVEFYEKQGLKRMDAIKACAKDRGVPKNQVYKELL